MENAKFNLINPISNDLDEYIEVTLKKKDISGFAETSYKFTSDDLVAIYGKMNAFRSRLDIERDLFLTQMRNQHKIINFLKLSNLLSEKLISENEYEEEISEHEGKYIVNVDKKIDFDTLRIISNIIQDSGIDYTLDEVSEIFSIDPLQLDQLSMSLIK